MGGSSASEMLLFIGAIIAAAALAGVVVTVAADYSAALEVRAENQATDLREEITIINDPAAVATNDLVLYVHNTGDSVVSVSQLVVFVDGQVETSVTADVLQSTDDARLFPGQVVELTVAVTTTGGDHEIQILSANGAKAHFSFFEP